MKFTQKHAKATAIILSLILCLSFVGCEAGMEAENYAPGENFAPSISGKEDAFLEDYVAEFATEAEAEAETDASGRDENEGKAFAENPFVSTEENNVSTFSADVDTASYSYFRKLVNSGYQINHLIGSGTAFRTEEFINYFKYDVPKPLENELFGVYSELTPCPWNAETVLLRLTLQAEQAREAKGNNLVFLIDVSGSMSSQDKLPLLKNAFSYLVSNLGGDDIVSIVTYSGREAVVLEGCNGLESTKIMNAINSLNSGGSTNGEAGLTRAYQIAEQYYLEDGNNRIIMASDGDLNVGISSQSELTSYIEQKRDQGVYLSVLGFGTGNYRDGNMEALADNGNGVYYYIDGESEAEKVFGTDLLGTLYAVAEDVKLQLEFDPEAVESYRLIGYENRRLSREDFEDDTKDAGEVGASHQVTVCYELKLASHAIKASPFVTLRVRYKNLGEPISLLNEYEIGQDDFSQSMSEDQRFICALIEACMVLHNSQYLGDLTVEGILEDLNSMELSEYPDRQEFRELVQKMMQLQ